MIRLPDSDMVKPPPQPVSRYAARTEWGGPASLGRDAMVRDLALRQGWTLADADLAEHRFAAWVGEQDARLDESAAALSPGDTKGFAERTSRDTFERAKAFKASLPAALKSAFDDRLTDYERRLFSKASNFEDRAQLQTVRDNLDTSLQEIFIPAAKAAGALAAGDPDKLDRLAEIKKRRFELIDRNPALAHFERKLRKAADNIAIDTAFAEALPPEEKRDLDPGAKIDTVGERVHRLEEDRRTAEVEASGDGARGQASANPEGFGAEAWLDLIRRYRPDVSDGKTISEILALRADPELSAEMRERGLAASARFLTDRGHAPTPGNLFLAHTASPETALLLLEADPDTSAVDVDPAAAAARPDLFFSDGDETKPRTVGEVLDRAEAKMAGTRLIDWRQQLTGASPDMQAALAADSREAEARAVAGAKMAAVDAYRRELADTESAIKAGTFSYADLVKAAGDGGWMKGDDFHRLLSLIFARQSANLKYERAISKYLDADYHFDSTSAEDQGDVDLLYERDPGNNAAGVVDGDPGPREALRRLTARTGIVPEQVRRAIETAITSGDEAAHRRALMLTEDILLWTVGENVPEDEKKLAEVISELRNLYYRELGDTASIAEVAAKIGELRDKTVRQAIGYFGQGAVGLYDLSVGYIDETLTEFRDGVHRLIEEGNKGRSAVEIANRKTVFDGLLTLAMVLLPGPGPRSKGRVVRRHKHTEAEYGLDPVSFQKVGYSETVNGRLRSVDTRTINGVEYKVFRVRTSARPSSDAAPYSAERYALNHPEPNAIYELDNGKRFKTNKFKHVVELEFKPVLVGRKARRKLGRDVAEKGGNPAGDEGGHFQARSLGGSSDRYNLFAQDASFNKREYRAWERHIERNINNVSNVKITVTRRNPINSRPDGLEIEWIENGKIRRQHFRNQAGG